MKKWILLSLCLFFTISTLACDEPDSRGEEICSQISKCAGEKMSKDDMKECSMSFNEIFDDMFNTVKGCDDLIDKYFDCAFECDNLAIIISGDYDTYTICPNEIAKVENCIKSQEN